MINPDQTHPQLLQGSMSEEEARKIGTSATRLQQLREGLSTLKGGGSLTLTIDSGSMSMALTHSETQACIWTLMDREAAFLSGFNVALSPLH